MVKFKQKIDKSFLYKLIFLFLCIFLFFIMNTSEAKAATQIRWVCDICGWTTTGTLPGDCPNNKASACNEKHFKKVYGNQNYTFMEYDNAWDGHHWDCTGCSKNYPIKSSYLGANFYKPKKCDNDKGPSVKDDEHYKVKWESRGIFTTFSKDELLKRKCSYCDKPFDEEIWTSDVPLTRCDCGRIGMATSDLNSDPKNKGGERTWLCGDCGHRWSANTKQTVCPKESLHDKKDGYIVVEVSDQNICYLCKDKHIKGKCNTSCGCGGECSPSGRKEYPSIAWKCTTCGGIFTRPSSVIPTQCAKGHTTLTPHDSLLGTGTGNFIGGGAINAAGADGAKKIFGSSVDTGYYEFPIDINMMKIIKEYEKKGKTLGENKLDFWKYLTDMYPGMDISLYPGYGHCVVFRDSFKNNTGGQPYVATGWLYLYSAEKDYVAFSENLAALAQADALPMYYTEEATDVKDGNVFLQFPGMYFYYPVSNMQIPEDGSLYQSQIYVPSSQTVVDTDVQEVIDEYFYAARNGKFHDIADFNAIAGGGDIKVYNEVLPKEDAWLMAFCNASLAENAFTDLGRVWESNYGKSYPLNKKVLNSKLTGLLGTELGYTLGSFMDMDYLLRNTDINETFVGFKQTAQIDGIDIVFNGAVSPGSNGFNIKKQIDDSGGLIDLRATLFRAYDLLMASGESNAKSNARAASSEASSNGIKLNAENITQIYNSSIVRSNPNVRANFINCNNTWVSARYIWSAERETLMADNGLNIARDTVDTYNVSTDLGGSGEAFKASLSDLRNNSMTKMFSDSGNTKFMSLDENGKLHASLVILQKYPEIAGIATMDQRVKKGIGSCSGITAVKKLNELALKDYYLWKETVIGIGEFFFEHCLASDTSSGGWTSTYSFIRKSDSSAGYARYSTLDTGIALCQIVEPLPKVSDFVLSNTYNTSESSYVLENNTTDNFIKFNPTGRNVIDWVHGATDISSMDESISGSSGGQSGLPNTKGSGLSTTVLDPNSSYKMFDVKCTVAKGGKTYGALGTDENNFFKIDPESDLATVFDKNPENVSFDTFVFVGRVPEAETDAVKVSDIQVLGKVLYNNFEVDFNPSFDDTRSVRNLVFNYLKDGSATEALAGYFSALNTDYNTQQLFNVYNSDGTNYKGQKAFQVKAVPTYILDMNEESIKNYQTTNAASTNTRDSYPEYGFSAASGITAGSWRPVSGADKFKAGTVVAYRFDYRIPNSDTIEAQRYLDSSIAFIRTGQWYYEYGSVLCADIDFWITPNLSSTIKDTFNKKNMNVNNDYARIRIQAPMMDNIYFTAVDVQGTVGGTSNYTATPYKDSDSGIKMASSGQGDGHTWYLKVGGDALLGGGNSSTSYGASNVTVGATWQYWCRGKSVAEADSSLYNYVSYFNGFKLDSGNLRADGTSGPSDNTMTMKLNPGHSQLTVNPNTDFMNAAKEKTLRLQVPKTECNDYIKDWEIIIVEFDVPEKDNAVIDLILESGGVFYGDVSRASGNNDEAQQIPQKLTGGTLYAVVERLAPSIEWKEEGKGTGIGLAFDVMTDDGQAYNRYVTGPSGGSVQGHSGVGIGAFSFKGAKLIFRRSISGPYSYLAATANYRNFDGYYDHEDINMTNNYWSEIWESKTNPNFLIDVVSSQENIQSTQTISACGGSCTLQPVEVRPKLTVQVAQDNPNATGAYATFAHLLMDGRAPEMISGFGYFGGSQIEVHFSGGDTSPKTITATWPLMEIPVGRNSSRNETYNFSMHINTGDCYRVYDETYFGDNTKEAQWTANVSCYENMGPCVTPYECAIFPKRRHQDALVFYTTGKVYKWDVLFEWSQKNDRKFQSTCMKNQDHIKGCTHFRQFRQEWDSELKRMVTVGFDPHPSHEHCFCYCNPSTHPGENNNEKWWRNTGGAGGTGAYGYGMYTESLSIHIYVNSSAHGLRDIAGGHTKIYAGENFNIWFEAIYSSSRSSLPGAPLGQEKGSHPYGDQGRNPMRPCCFTCNQLQRYPGVWDVAGPNLIDLKVSGTQDYNYDKRSIGPHASDPGNGPTYKRFMWYPIPGTVFVEDSQIVCQTASLYIAICDFFGHREDTWHTLQGSIDPGYAWNTRDKHVFADAKTGTIQFCPSKAYIGSAMDGEGLDVSSGGSGEGGGYVDGDIWIQ